MKVTKAVIPAAGLGTRVLPATKAMPKEMRQAMRLAMYANRINDIQQKNVEKKEAVQG